mmetsp:Transcript_93179/g.221645  ORF Transcript_93179/g.221645 Transcript_93179/m.221645 type:complete len:359 (-) Transcript_93179:770-1846(-)
MCEVRLLLWRPYPRLGRLRLRGHGPGLLGLLRRGNRSPLQKLLDLFESLLHQLLQPVCSGLQPVQCRAGLPVTSRARAGGITCAIDEVLAALFSTLARPLALCPDVFQDHVLSRDQLAGDLPSQVHHVPDRALVGLPKLQDDLHELWEVQSILDAVLAPENVIREVDDGDWVDAHLLQRQHGLRHLQDLHKLRLRDIPVVVGIPVLEQSLELHGDHVHHHVFLLCGRNSRHHFAKDTDEHIQHSAGCQYGKDEDQHEASDTLGPYFVAERGDVVQESAVDEERVHGVLNCGEVKAAHHRARSQLSEGDGKHVDDNHQKTHHEKDGARSGRHALDEDHQLRYGSQHPCHARQPQQAKQA